MSLLLFVNSSLHTSIIENDCTEDFANHIDGETIIEKNTFDGFKVVSDLSLLFTNNFRILG